MKKHIVGVLALLVVGIIASTGFASAHLFGMSDDAREALESGDFDEWKTAMTESMTKERFDQVRQRHQERLRDDEVHQAMMQAIEDNDFDTWKEASSLLDHFPKDVESLTQEDFDLMVQMHQARINGEETGCPLAGGFGGRGMHHNWDS